MYIRNKYGLALLLGVVLAAIMLPHKASALYSTAQIDSRLRQGVQSAVIWDTCRNNLTASSANIRDNINGVNAYVGQSCSYQGEVWLSGRGTPKVVAPISVSYSQTSVNLQINAVKFITGSLVERDLGCVSGATLRNDSSRWVTSISNANDRRPNAIGNNCMRPALVSTYRKVSSISVQSGGGSVSGGVGSVYETRRDSNSRYWFASPVNITYNNVNITDGLVVTLKLDYKEINSYYNPWNSRNGRYYDIYCTTWRSAGQPANQYQNSPGGYDFSEIDNCGVESTYLTITFRKQPPPLSYSLTPQVSAASAYIEAGEPVNFSYSVNNSGPNSSSSATSIAVKQYVLAPGQDLLTYSQQDEVGSNCNNAFSNAVCASSWQLPNRAFPRNATTTVTTAGASPAYVSVNTSGLAAGSRICQILAVSPGVMGASVVNNRWSAPRCVTVANKPYFNVLGGDILSGGGIRSWNQDGGAYAGAGSQLAALASGNIQNFVTGSGLSGGAATRSGSALGFSNSGVSAPTYGKNYMVPTTTMPSLVATQTISTPDLDLRTLNEGVYTRSGNLTIHGTVPAGVHATILVTSGNLYVSQDVKYAAYGSVANVPRLSVYVQNGNISVNRDVAEMHGIYYAAGAAAGNFISCGTPGFTSVDLSAPTGFDTCNKKLTVYGSVIANKLILSRTSGSLRTGQPAETFYYTPELWAAPAGAATMATTPTYNSYVSLPPIL